MSVENIKKMKERLVDCTQKQLDDISNVDTHELGEAIDMIKDLAEAEYYCTITKSMEDADKKEEEMRRMNYYPTTTPSMKMYPYYKEQPDMMYYPGRYIDGGNFGNEEWVRDPREGQSSVRRRMYAEGKNTHKDSTSQLHELEAYLQEISGDFTEIIKEATPEEKNTLRQKMTMLADKIV